MSVRRNPPSFVVIDSVTGRVGYTKRATGMGNEAIAACAARARELACRTGHSQIVFLELYKRTIGQTLNVGMVRSLGITEEIHPDGRVTRDNPRRVRRNIFTFNNPPSGPADPTAARELELYIDNDADLYRQQFIPIVKNLMLKRRRGVYDRELAVKLFMYLMDAGAKKYLKEFGTGGKIDTVFNRNTRLQAARAFRDSFETEAELGNYDRLIGPVSNPRRIRKNVYAFNNPRGDNQMETAARAVGLLVTTWAPGDGVTRYRFFRATRGARHADYHQGGALYTAMGRKDAMNFLKSYGLGKMFRSNPSSGARKFISTEIGHLRRKGYPRARAAAAAYSMARKKGYRVNPSPIDPPGLAELDARMNELMRQMDAMKRAKTDGSPQYMILLKEAQAVSRERVKLLGLRGKVLPNPLLQTVFAANPPVSDQWNRMTSRQRLAALEVVGYDTDFAGSMARRLWMTLPAAARVKLEEMWLDTSSRGTTRRRVAAPVGANPLTRSESAHVLKQARRDVRMATVFRPGHTRSEKSGQAYARASVVKVYGPNSARRAANKIQDRAQAAVGTTMSNPGVRLPRPGTRLTVAQALELAQRLGNKSLVKQCHAAMKLQKAANRGAKCVIWKVFPMGSSNKIDNVVALTHYGDSPETMYKPPKGSKKGNHMYRHTWGEKGGKPSVPLLASPDGKMLMMPLEGKKIASDWLRH